MLGSGPFGHVRTDLADHLQRRESVHPVKSGQIHPGHPVQLALDIEAGRVLLIALLAVGSRRLAVAAVFRTAPTAFLSLGRTPQSCPDRSGKAPAPGSARRGAPAASVPAATWRWSSRQPWFSGRAARPACGDSSPPDYGLDDVHTGLAGDVPDHVPQPQVHLRQRLLHVLHVLGSILHQHGPLPQVAAQPPDVPAQDGRLRRGGRRCATATATGSLPRRSCGRARS